MERMNGRIQTLMQQVATKQMVREAAPKAPVAPPLVASIVAITVMKTLAVAANMPREPPTVEICQ